MTSTSSAPDFSYSSCGSFIEALTVLFDLNMTSKRFEFPLVPREFEPLEATELERTKMPSCVNECTF